MLTFTVLDLFLFCVFFEALLIPMFFVVAVYGTRERRFYAVTYFYLYTLLGSVFLIIALMLLYSELHTTSYGALLNPAVMNNMNPAVQNYI